MRFTPVRVAMLIALSACTALVTSHFFGPSRGRVHAATDDKPRVAMRASGPNTPAPAGSMPSDAVRLYKTTNIRPLQVEVRGPDVIVGTIVDISDLMPYASYLWALEITNSADKSKVLPEQFYTHQVFKMPDGENEMHPTFKEHVRLAPGVYSAVVRLYEIPPGFDLAKLTQGQKMGRTQVLGSRGTVTVGF